MAVHYSSVNKNTLLDLFGLSSERLSASSLNDLQPSLVNVSLTQHKCGDSCCYDKHPRRDKLDTTTCTHFSVCS